MAFFMELPSDLLIWIFHFCKVQSLVRLATVSKDVKKASDRERRIIEAVKRQPWCLAYWSPGDPDPLIGINGIDDYELKAFSLACAKGLLMRLEVLDLGESDYSDDGIMALASACEKGALPRLKIFNSWTEKITDKSILAIVSACKKGAFTQLVHLSIINLLDSGPPDECQMGNAGYTSLANALTEGYLPCLKSVYFLNYPPVLKAAFRARGIFYNERRGRPPSYNT
jgi:hypothetical protein